MIAMLWWIPAAGQLDTLVSGVSETDTLLGDTIICYPYECHVQKGHGYELPYAFGGVVDIGGTAGAVCEISFITIGDSMHYDTCVILSPFAGTEARFFWRILADCQMLVAGPEGTEIHVTAKMDTSTVHHLLPPTQFLLSSLCPTDMPPARETTYAYLKIDTWEAFQPPLEPGLYFVLDSQTMMPTGRKIRVFD